MSTHGSAVFPSLRRPDSSRIVDSFCYLFAYERIAVCGDDFTEVHRGRDNIHVVKRLYEALNLWILKACVGEHSRDVGIKFPRNVEKNSGVFAAAKAYAYLPVVVVVPLYDAGLRDLDFSFKRERL